MEKNEAGRTASGWSFPLEPMSLGEIIDNTLYVFRHRWKDYLMISLIYATPMMVLFFISFSLGLSGKRYDSPDVIFFNLTSSAVGWLLYMLLSVMIIRITQGIVEGKDWDFKEGFRFLRKTFIPYALTIFLNGVAITGLAIIALGVTLPAFFLTREGGLSGRFLFLIYVMVILVGFMYALSMLLLVSSAALIEGNFYGSAISRSIKLFNTSWETRWKIMTLPGLTQLLIIILTAFIPIIGYFFMMLLTPIPIIALTLVYYDVRIRTEGLDLEIEADRILESEGKLS